MEEKLLYMRENSINKNSNKIPSIHPLKCVLYSLHSLQSYTLLDCSAPEIRMKHAIISPYTTRLSIEINAVAAVPISGASKVKNLYWILPDHVLEGLGWQEKIGNERRIYVYTTTLEVNV